MIGLQEAFEKAFIRFENTMSVKGIDQAYDIGEYWLFLVGICRQMKYNMGMHPGQ